MPLCGVSATPAWCMRLGSSSRVARRRLDDDAVVSEVCSRVFHFGKLGYGPLEVSSLDGGGHSL